MKNPLRGRVAHLKAGTRFNFFVFLYIAPLPATRAREDNLYYNFFKYNNGRYLVGLYSIIKTALNTGAVYYFADLLQLPKVSMKERNYIERIFKERM